MHPLQDGEGKMVVIAVGESTYQEGLLSEKKGGDKEGDDDDEDEGDGKSILQRKLNDMCVPLYCRTRTHTHTHTRTETHTHTRVLLYY